MVNLIQIAPKNAPTFAMSRQKAAELLGISVDSVAFLLKSRYLPDLDAGRLIAMANQPWLYTDGDFPVLQQGASELAPKKMLPARKYIGESAIHSDAECVEANQGQWAGSTTSTTTTKSESRSSRPLPGESANWERPNSTTSTRR